MDESNNGETTPRNLLKRPRPVISCLECRRKKLKCSRTQPCQQCTKSGKVDSCSFQAGQEPAAHVSGSEEPVEKRGRTDTSSHTNGIQTASRYVVASGADSSYAIPASGHHSATQLGLFEQLQQRVANLESVVGVSPAQIDKHSSHDPEHVPLRTPAPSRPRQSMPINIFPNAARFLKSWTSTSDDADPRAKTAASDLRQLSDTLKQLHKRPGGLIQESPSRAQILRLIPSQTVCQTLIEMYFDNLEHCFRILHRPTFDRQLQNFFSGGAPDISLHFLPQLIAILAISCMLGIQSECVEIGNAFGGELIYTSVDFIQDHLSKMKSKDIHTIPGLQTRMLLLLLRWMRLDKMSEIWELSGQVLRQALIMGLDSEPTKTTASTSILEAELRRRLWMTVCEQDMMTSILCSMPCLIPDFDCHIPLNVDDAELEQSAAPLSRPFDVWTDTL